MALQLSFIEACRYNLATSTGQVDYCWLNRLNGVEFCLILYVEWMPNYPLGHLFIYLLIVRFDLTCHLGRSEIVETDSNVKGKFQYHCSNCSLICTFVREKQWVGVDVFWHSAIPFWSTM